MNRIFTALLLVFPFLSDAQTGGNNTMEFLNLVPSSLAAATGGSGIANPTEDVSLVWQNPALLNEAMHNKLQLSFADYLAGINFGQAGYAAHFPKFGSAAATVHYINYGKMDYTDEAANVYMTGRPGEVALSLSYSKALDSLFYLGGAIKGVYSNLYPYTSSALAWDLGAVYRSKKKFFTAAIVARNGGRQLTTYNGIEEDLPFEMHAGFTMQLPKAPFRLGITYQNLEKFNLNYDDPNIPDIDPLTGEPNKKRNSFWKKLSRHPILSAELLLTKNFNIRLGYNFKRRAELAIENRRALVGLSAGVGIKISKFTLDYARSVYVLKEGVNQLTIGVRLNDFRRKTN